jgi:hypothetical protein
LELQISFASTELPAAFIVVVFAERDQVIIGIEAQLKVSAVEARLSRSGTRK